MYIYSRMLIRNLCQKDYTEAPINKDKGINECCVLTCVQMIVESKIGEPISQNGFYKDALYGGAIRADGYINNYDRLMIADSLDLANLDWCFSHNLKDLKEQLAKNNPVVCYIGGHAVLAIDVVDDYNALPGVVTVVDPKYKGDKAVYAMKTDKIKRMGYYK